MEGIRRMASTWTFDGDGRATMTVTAPCTNAECLAALDELTRDPRWRTPGRLLVDRRAATPHTRAEIEQILTGFSARPAMARATVIVVVDSALAYGSLRMAQIMAETQNLSFHVEVVKDFEEGRRLLAG